LLKKDVGVKNGLYAAMWAGQSQLAAGHVYWMKDIVEDDTSLQAEYDALPAREQSCATHLQTLTRDLRLYYAETVISRTMKSKLVELFREKSAANEELKWTDAKSLFKRNLVDVDPRFLVEAVFTVRRDELSTLLVWINFFVTLMKYCTDAAITLPKHLYFTMFIVKVSPKEVNHVTFAYPKTHNERERFNFERYRAAVKRMPQHNFPPLHQKEVRSFTKLMFVPPDLVKLDRDNSDDKKGDKETQKKDKYCRTCKCKHANTLLASI
jgi:hypothetical protein